MKHNAECSWHRLPSKQRATDSDAQSLGRTCHGDGHHIATLYSGPALMKQLGLSLQPNRVMVIKLDNKDTSSVSFDVAFTQAVGTIETISEQTANFDIAGLRARSLADNRNILLSALDSIASTALDAGCAPTGYTSNPRLQHRLQSVA